MHWLPTAKQQTVTAMCELLAKAPGSAAVYHCQWRGLLSHLNRPAPAGSVAQHPHLLRDCSSSRATNAAAPARSRRVCRAQQVWRCTCQCHRLTPKAFR